jgi:hypothetical protein
MKKILVVSMVLNGALMAGVMMKKEPQKASAQECEHAQGGCTRCNGDTTGDGERDITDAIRLLNYIFVGGDVEPPVPWCGLLPATGQTKCYTDVGREVDCRDALWRGQDGAHQAGCPMENRFRVNDGGTPFDLSDDTVTDNCTGLMWQRSTANPMSWQEALQYCEDLNFSGHDDWRLPNTFELYSLVNFNELGGTDTDIFELPGSGYYWYWTSTTYPSNDNNEVSVVVFGDYWSADPYYGPVSWAHKLPGLKYNFRAVRTIQPGE